MTGILAIGFLYLLPGIYSAITDNILGGGLEQDGSEDPNGIFSGCTEMPLGGIRTAVEARIYTSLYHCNTPINIYIYIYIYTVLFVKIKIQDIS